MIFPASGAVALARIFITQAGQFIASADAIAVAGFRSGLDGNERHSVSGYQLSVDSSQLKAKPIIDTCMTAPGSGSHRRNSVVDATARKPIEEANSRQPTANSSQPTVQGPKFKSLSAKDSPELKSSNRRLKNAFRPAPANEDRSEKQREMPACVSTNIGGDRRGPSPGMRGGQ